MQDIDSLRPAGAVIQDRFVVEQLLGRGGFSAVYLVRDQQNNDAKYALKELMDQDRQEKNKFAFECQVLKRLNHPALPHVHWVEENDRRAYLFMDYIEGPNLEVLRRQQPDRCFPLSQVLTLLAPIVNALEYLHGQSTPIIHRDIKPANIIVPTMGKPSMLVDFGIAKEYTSDSTTTVVRHCSPGYGAPEQYSTGTDLRTDVYGLAATMYTLLTGVVPVDALQRATKIAGRNGDPLVSLQKLIPSLPTYVVEAVHRALSISGDKRFASVREFWEAVQPSKATPQFFTLLFQRNSAKVAQLNSERSTGPIVVRNRKLLTSKTEIALLTFLAVAVVLGAILSIGYYRASTQSVTTVAVPSSLSGATNNPAPTPTTDPSSPHIAGPYSGTVHNLATNETTSMTITGLTQNGSNISGYFIGLNMEGSFTGVLDTSRHFLFTVKRDTQLPLFFDGVIRQDSNIVGNYCTVDKAGQCVGDYGIWSLKKAQGL